MGNRKMAEVWKTARKKRKEKLNIKNIEFNTDFY